MPLAVQRLLGVGCFAGAICILSVNRGWFAAILSWAPLRQLGLWSFSIYLWQQPFYLWMHSNTRLSPMLALTLALICGLISYYLIERPARIYLNTHWGVRAVDAQSGKDRLLTGPPHTTRHAGPHRAVHEQGAHDFSSVAVSLHPEITDTHQPLRSQPIVRHPDLRRL